MTEHILCVFLSTEQCLTEACVTVASSILSAMDHTADPCEDFYQYTCGGWTSSHPIPSGLNRWGTFGVMWKENQLVMRNVLGQSPSVCQHPSVNIRLSTSVCQHPSVNKNNKKRFYLKTINAYKC